MKSLVCIAIVLFALQWRAEPPASNPGLRARVPAPTHSGRPSIEERAGEWAEAGAEAIAAAARDKCLAAPRDCVATLRSLQSAGRDR